MIIAIDSPDVLIAYLDPGTGSMFLQVGLGILFGGLLLLKIYWKRVKGIAKSMFRR